MPRSATLTVRPIQIQSLSLSPNPFVGGATGTGTIILECPAGPGAITVTLSSSIPGIAKPQTTSVSIPEGPTSATFQIATVDVLAIEHVIITATANGKSVSQTLTVNL